MSGNHRTQLENKAPGVSSQCKIRAKPADLSSGVVGVRHSKQTTNVKWAAIGKF